MLEGFRSSFCCVNDDPQITINVELLNCKGFSKLNKQSTVSESNKQSIIKFSPVKDFGADFADYSFYVMVEYNGGTISSETDFLYLKEEFIPVPETEDEMETNLM
jgi:hypothetical protein